MDKAVEFLGRAGSLAVQQVAHSEALGYFIRALELLKRLPDNRDRAQREMDLQIALGSSAFVAGGPRAPEGEPALVRANELGEQLGDNIRLMEALMFLAHLRHSRREFERSLELNERLLALAERAETPAIIAGAHTLIAVTLFSTAQLEASREHFERAIELFGVAASSNFRQAFYPRPVPGLLIAYNALAPGVLAVVLTILGYPSIARRRSVQVCAVRDIFHTQIQMVDRDLRFLFAGNSQ